MSDSTSLDWLNRSPYSRFRFAGLKSLWLQPPAEHKSGAGRLKWGWGFVGRWRCLPLQLYRCCCSKSIPLLKLPKISLQAGFVVFLGWQWLWVWFSWAEFLNHIFELLWWSNMEAVRQHLRSTPPTKTTKDGKMPRCDKNWCLHVFLPEVFFESRLWGGCVFVDDFGMSANRRRN